MLRRTFVTGALGAVALPGRPFAQSGVTPRVGWITAQRDSSLSANLEAFRTVLARLGYAEGQSVEIVFRYGDDDPLKVPGFAAEMERFPVDVVVVQGVAVSILSRLGLRVPIVYITSGDPIAAGYAESLAKPHAGMTGVTLMVAELNVKRMAILKEVIPELNRVAVVANPQHPGESVERGFAEHAGRLLGLKIDYYQTRNEQELASAFAAISKDPPRAMSVFSDGFALQNSARLAEFALAQRIAMIAGWAAFSERGALCSYGPPIAEAYGKLAYYVHRILKGSTPAELPIEQPTQFELVVNLRTAGALGLAISPNFLIQADRLIEA